MDTSEEANFHLFREILSTPLIAKSSTPSSKKPRKARNKKTGAGTTKSAPGSSSANINTDEHERDDAAELGEFIVHRSRDLHLLPRRSADAQLLRLVQLQGLAEQVHRPPGQANRNLDPRTTSRRHRGFAVHVFVSASRTNARRVPCSSRDYLCCDAHRVPAASEPDKGASDGMRDLFERAYTAYIPPSDTAQRACESAQARLAYRR